MRSLDAEEERLWAKVVATIRPLSRQPTGFSPAGGAEPPKPLEVASRAVPRSQPPLHVPVRPPRAEAHSEATLDSGWDRRLRSGDVRPDRVIDLHGLSLDSAWEAIDSGLEKAIAAGDRLVLLITGHAPSGEPPAKRGKIRAAVHDWLAVSRHSADIAAVRGAHRRHGGGGSLYMVLRRKGRRSTVS